MKQLTIVPTYSCPCKCKFCYYLNKTNDTTVLDISVLEKYLKKHAKEYDKVVISGGNQLTLGSVYLNELVSLLKKYYTDIEMEIYPLYKFEKIDGVTYNISYDFLSRTYARQVWDNISALNYPYNIVVTLTPFMHKMHPYNIVRVISRLKNIEKLKFRYYTPHNDYRYDVSEHSKKEYIEAIKNINLSLPFGIEFVEECEEYVINPYGNVMKVVFDKGLREEVPNE